MSQAGVVVTAEERTAAAEVVSADLEHLLEAIQDELSRLSGGTLLITGGAGFLGYYLVQVPLAWNDRNHGRSIQVVVYDNFFRGLPAWLAQLAGRPDLTLVEHDLRLGMPANAGPFDFIIHSAGIASPSVYRQYPIETMDANVMGLRALLDHAAREPGAHSVSGLLFFSSSEIYGDPVQEAVPTPETYRGNVSCTGPRACYDESKRYGETLCVNFARVRGVPATIARPFNNYGPGMNITDGRAVADFAHCVLDDRDIVLFSDGSPTRTFCYVADAVAGYYKILVHGRPGEPYNIGAEVPEISMSELAELVRSIGAALFGYRGRVRFEASPDGDYLIDNPARRRPDIEKARRELGYLPVFSLDEGLRRTLLWYGDHREGAAS